VFRTSPWESFYRAGTLAACPTGDDDNYSRQIRDGWTEYFASLPDGTRILDLGTGNGALPLIALETAKELDRRFSIHGVDRARIDPRAQASAGADAFGDVTFHPGTPAEDLPFDAESFDAVVGQYSVEYTDVPRTLAECARVLACGGGCRFVLHHARSRVIDNARESLDQWHAVEASGMFPALRECIGEGAARAAAEKRLYDSGRDFLRKFGGAANPFFVHFLLDSIESLLTNRAALAPDALLGIVDRFEADLGDWATRLQQLVAVALDLDQLEALLEQARTVGFEVEGVVEVHENDGTLLGWVTRLLRRDQGTP
jgi:ubiquinone/menaquinone biosynthesis C-methylase UbiE